MYKIINADGRELGMTERPYYIMLSENGSYTPCSEKEAQGVALNGTPYHLFGRTAMEGLETVVLAENDAGRVLKEQETVNSIAFVTLAEAGQIDTTTAAEHAAQFGEWTYPVAYTPGQMRVDPLDGCLYRVNEGQGHTSQQGWNPSLVPALWTKVADPTDEWQKWAQPIGAHDAYNAGDKVSHNGKTWTSDLDNNVWEPGVYGWTETKPI